MRPVWPNWRRDNYLEIQIDFAALRFRLDLSLAKACCPLKLFRYSPWERGFIITQHNVTMALKFL